jgi:thiamine kinase
VRVPAVGELVEVNGRLGLPMEKLSGQPLALRLIDSVSGTEAGSIAAQVHAAMHALSAPGLTDMRVQFRKIIDAGPLSAETKARVLQTMDTLPDGDRVCHGDFHAANIMMTDAGPVVIDCVVAHRGNPIADVAQTRVAMTEWLYSGLPVRSKQAVESFIQAYERRYFELTGAHRDEVAAWLPIVAAVRFSVPHQPWSHEPLLRMIEATRGQ